MTEHQQKIKIASYILMATGLLFLFYFHLMPSVIGAMAVFLIVRQLHGWLATKVHGKWAHTITVLLLCIVTVIFFTSVGAGIYSALQMQEGSSQKFADDAFHVLQQIKNYLPQWLVQYIPEDVIKLKEHALEMLKSHLPNMLVITGASAKVLVHVLIGMFIGAIIAFSVLKTQKDASQGPLSLHIMQRIGRFGEVFKQVMFAQVKISFINAVLTAIYLLILLPLMGYHIPYSKMLVLLTFLFGLLPVVGNLVSNSLIVVFSLMLSFEVAIASLGFLIVVHKLEYYINAKIVGSQIKISIWELIVAMLVMQAVFGVIGTVLAPVIYGYIKEELKSSGLI